jgi:hypothetical protein
VLKYQGGEGLGTNISTINENNIITTTVPSKSTLYFASALALAQAKPKYKKKAPEGAFKLLNGVQL